MIPDQDSGFALFENLNFNYYAGNISNSQINFAFVHQSIQAFFGLVFGFKVQIQTGKSQPGSEARSAWVPFH
jgi:hypothetical protein